ncbi:hypothetical protein COU91_02230 [Candidatus Saccharibacteria bacterium CG10_big_fil_rev_8_21_14_0_10_47_8]|nr:MAG: hypothetical protein COU91_02230 [Candidatus Saccharibacteria bacterium CG10_big_fil_rev_8_21_14_0_10_47_8]
MTSNELLHSPVSQLDYQRGKTSALPPDELHHGELYTARLLLGEVVRPAETKTGIYAVSAFVEVEHVSDDRRRFAVIRYVSEDGLPEGPAYRPNLSEDGIMQGTAAPLPTREGYLLHSTGPLEEELRELEEGMLVRVPAARTRAIAIEQPLPYQKAQRR